MRIVPAASRLVTMVLSWASPNSVSTPVPGIKLAVIAIVVVLLQGSPPRRRALAVNGLEWGAAARGWPLSSGRHDRLEAELRPVLNLSGDFLEIFRIRYSAIAPMAAGDGSGDRPKFGRPMTNLVCVKRALRSA